MPAGLKTKSIKGVIWATGDSVGVALLSFVTFIILARALEPQDFGIVALATVFVFFFNLLAAHTFSDVIVQRAHLDADHVDTAFWTTLTIALVFMAGCLAGADALAALLDEPKLAPVLRWLSLILPLSAIGAIPLALYRRDMRFDVVAKRNVAGRCAGAFVGIGMALTGWGLWSLVAQQLAGTLVVTVAMCVSSWRPRFRFSFARLAEMWGFGINVSLAQVVSGVSEQVLNLLIGWIFGSIALGYFAIAWRMVQLVKSLISSAVYYVGLSAFAKLQKDRAAVAAAFLQSTRIACLVGFPIAVGMSFAGRPLVDALFGDKWDASIPILMVLAFEMIPAFYCIFLSSLYRAMNRPFWVLVMALVYLVTAVGAVLLAAPWGVTAIAIFWVARELLLVPVHMALVQRLLSIPFADLVRPMLTPLAAAVVMGLGVALLRFVFETGNADTWLELLALVPAGAVLYGAVVWLLSPQLFFTALQTAAVMFDPLRRKPAIVSKEAET